MDVVGSRAVFLRTAGRTDLLQVRGLPLRSIEDLRVDYDGRFGQRTGSFDSSTVWTEGDDFWWEVTGTDSAGQPYGLSGVLRAAGSWPSVPGSVKVVYWAGYKEAELSGTDSVLDASAIRRTAVREAARRARRIFSTSKGAPAPLVSERLGEYSYQVEASLARTVLGEQGALTPESQQALEQFVNYAVKISV